MSQKREEIELCFTGAKVHLAGKGTNFGGGPEVRECEGPKVRKCGGQKVRKSESPKENTNSSKEVRK